MTADYESIKDGLSGIIAELSDQALDGNRRLSELQEKLNLQQFNLVVMGQFKRGKSPSLSAAASKCIKTAGIKMYRLFEG